MNEQDAKSIEGSAARAADRGREEDLGLVISDTPSLGNPVVVRAMLGEFGVDLMEIRKRWATGDSTNPQEEVRDLCRSFSLIVMGHDPRYAALPWHSVGRLGRQINKVVRAEEGVTDPGELLFLSLSGSLLAIAGEVEKENMSDADAQKHTQEILDDATLLITGAR